MTARFQKYRLKWPLTASQLINIDEMFSEIYEDLYNHTISVNVDQIVDLPVTVTPPSTAGQYLLGSGSEDSSESNWRMPGQRGPQGLQGVPGIGIPGRDGDDRNEWPLFAPLQNLIATVPIILSGTVLSHSTANGYVHLPINGATAQLLQYASAGTAKWATVSGDAVIADGGALAVNKTRLNVRNETGSTIVSTRAVYISGFNNLPLITLAENTDETKHNVVGITIAPIADDTDGYIATSGQCDAETNAWNVGTELYLSTAGALTSTAPTSGDVQHVGIVTVKENYPVGKILLYFYPESNILAAPSAQSCIIRMGDAIGATKTSFRDYANAEVASIDSDGTFLTASTIGVTGTRVSKGWFTDIALTNALTVANGGTGLATIADGSVLAANSADTLTAITWHAAGTKYLTNTSGTISWEAGGAGGASAALDNLASVAINESLVSDTDITDDLGTGDIRWKDIHAATLNAGLTATDTLKLRGRDVDLGSYVDVLTITSANTVTADLNAITTIGGVTIASVNVATLSSLTTVGALNAGSITSGFGAIDVGADAISCGVLTPSEIKLTAGGIHPNTADGSDNSYTWLGGGGALDLNRGAFIVIYGNEQATPGSFQIACGDVAGAKFRLDWAGGIAFEVLQSTGKTTYNCAVQMTAYGAGAATFDASGNITSTGISTTVTTGSLVGKTLTFVNGVCTGFA
jgi:hypothetical protein